MDEPTNAQASGQPNWLAGTVNNQSPPVEKAETKKVDHLAEIAELAKSLHNVSPSGAETVSGKILQHLADHKDPKAYDERMAKEKKAKDELDAANAKDREKNKAKVA